MPPPEPPIVCVGEAAFRYQQGNGSVPLFTMAREFAIQGGLVIIAQENGTSDLCRASE